VRSLHRYRFVLLAATAIVLVAATVYTLRDGDERKLAGKLGPTSGTSAQYVVTKAGYLDRLALEDPSKQAAALVSLNGYVPASRVQAMTKSLKATVVILRFPAGEQELQFVRTTITDALADRATDLRHELEAEIAALEAQAKDARGEQDEDLVDLIATRRAELAKVKADCACVFAFAVEGASLEQLKDLASKPEVRLVDVPQPLTSDLGGWELGPIVPTPKAV
jgi:hypothetical protein